MKNVVVEALEAMGLALAGHNHRWTPRERSLFERAIAHSSNVTHQRSDARSMPNSHEQPKTSSSATGSE